MIDEMFMNEIKSMNINNEPCVKEMKYRMNKHRVSRAKVQFFQKNNIRGALSVINLRNEKKRILGRCVV